MAEPESGKQLAFGMSFDSLADELEGKEGGAADAKNLAENIFDVVYGSQGAAQGGAVQTEEQSDFSLFGRRLAKDVRVDFGAGVGKIHHENGDLTVFNPATSFTQTTEQGAFFRVGSDEESQVIFHLRLDGDIDVIGPGFDDTLRLDEKMSAKRSARNGAPTRVWVNIASTIEVRLNLETGATDVKVKTEPEEGPSDMELSQEESIF